MRLIFAGTPPFAATALKALIDAGHEIGLVLTQPDRPSGRGMKLQESAVALLASAHCLPIAKFSTLKSAEAQIKLREINAEVMVVAAYGLLLPQVVLDIPQYGCLNIHGSLLPRWRGAAPVQRAIEAGDQETGICIMQMDAGLDTGPVLLEKRVAIDAKDTSLSLMNKLAELGGQAIVEALNGLNSLAPRIQHNVNATYAKKIEKSESTICWSDDAMTIERRIRAFDPFPGMSATWTAHLNTDQPTTLKIWNSMVMASTNNTVLEPGQIAGIDGEGLVVACGENGQQRLLVTMAQVPGAKRVKASLIAKNLNLAVLDRAYIASAAASAAPQ